MFDPNQIARTHLFGNPRQQCPTFAELAGYRILREQLTTLVPALYGYDKAFILSRLMALFHTLQRRASCELARSASQYGTDYHVNCLLHPYYNAAKPMSLSIGLRLGRKRYKRLQEPEAWVRSTRL
jgi:hypothetical protein